MIEIAALEREARVRIKYRINLNVERDYKQYAQEGNISIRRDTGTKYEREIIKRARRSHGKTSCQRRSGGNEIRAAEYISKEAVIAFCVQI